MWAHYSITPQAELCCCCCWSDSESHLIPSCWWWLMTDCFLRTLPLLKCTPLVFLLLYVHCFYWHLYLLFLLLHTHYFCWNVYLLCFCCCMYTTYTDIYTSCVSFVACTLLLLKFRPPVFLFLDVHYFHWNVYLLYLFTYSKSAMYSTEYKQWLCAVCL